MIRRSPDLPGHRAGPWSARTPGVVSAMPDSVQHAAAVPKETIGQRTNSTNRGASLAANRREFSSLNVARHRCAP